ncbi:MAG TPA: proton-conducting transporter membrane subunit [Candidatus Marinimicrobia bacterium]|nr:proton-conducting transporter membrane subunit [Candidatus Neomarinimicrobiota bacterium]HRS51587.1 proton-conducting transporter membrane subunit [Candidatus Neomarinimicrobiota bacterium]HRU92335.1 proton-conducting transporter membrane subunit [Candidatus Neomarinimicrobiota bacterium]
MSNSQSIIYFIPEIILFITVIGFLLLTTFVKLSDRQKYLLICLGLIISLLATFISHSSEEHGLFNNLLVWDSYGQFIKTVILSIALIILILRWQEICSETGTVTEFGIAFLLLISAALVTVTANHLIVLFITLQIVHLSSFLIVQDRNCGLTDINVSWHDLIFDIIASLIMLMGIAMIYSVTGTFFIAEIGQILSPFARLSFPLILGIALFLVGFSYTISGIFRLNWKLEILRTTPAPDRLLILTMPQFIETATLIRLLRVGFGTVGDLKPLTLMIGIFAVLALLYPIFWLMRSRSATDIMIVSSVAQTGFGLLALSAGNLSGDVAALFYQIVLVLSLIAFTTGEILTTTDETHSKSGQLIALASLIGIPLTAGFPAKYLVFVSLLRSNPCSYFFIVAGIGSAALLLIGYGRLVRQIIVQGGPFSYFPGKGKQLTFLIRILIILLLIIGGFYWTPLTDHIQSIMVFCLP